MNKQIKDLSIDELKIAIFDYSEQSKNINAMINELYKELSKKIAEKNDDKNQ
jgi:hypothetical protein